MKNSRVWMLLGAGAAALIWSAGAGAQAPSGSKTITEADCTAAKLGDSIPIASIGEPVSAVTLSAPRWNAAAKGLPPYCTVNGAMAPVDHAPTAKPINFQVAFPSTWNGRAAQLGRWRHERNHPGAYGRRPGESVRSGLCHLWQRFRPPGRRIRFWRAWRGRRKGGPRRIRKGPGAQAGWKRAWCPGHKGPADRPSDDWALNDEAIKNLGYMQMKKTHDAAMVLIERMYGERPKYNYYIGTSQGGREALTVAQRYPADYDGVAANVPIVNFSTLMLAPELIRIQEKPAANWVTPAKVNAIRGEFMRQCDKLDGLVDGIINNYMACRAIFDVKQGAQEPPSVGREALSEQRRSESGGYQRERVPHGRPDLDARVRLHALPVRGTAGERREDFRDVAAEHGSQRQRSDHGRALPRAGRRAADARDAQPPRRAGRDRVPDEGPAPRTRWTTWKAASSPRAAPSCRHGSIPPIPICPRSRSAAAR